MALTLSTFAFRCGAYGYPVLAATRVAVDALRVFLQNDTVLERVLLCYFTDEVWSRYQEALGMTSTDSSGPRATLVP